MEEHGKRNLAVGVRGPLDGLVHAGRLQGAKVLKAVLGEVFSGILCSDKYGAYNAYHKGVRQVYWAHIIRTVRGIKHASRDGHLDRKTLIRKSVPLRARINRCLQTYELSSDPEVARTARGLLKYWNHLFTFREHDGVEPTNNSAERGIPPAVQWRKICFGKQSEEGELLTAGLLTVTRRCADKQRNAFSFLVDAINAHRLRLPLPSLLPLPR